MEKIYKKEIQRLMPLFQAIAEGKTIDYRIKPEPKYRPFKNAEECWQEMQKHQPFGWVKWNDVRYNIYVVSLTSASLINGNCKNMDFAYAYQKLIFDDGAPFGIKMEE